MGFKTPITISKIIEGIQANSYVLPAIQREFVWKPAQVEKLFDSLLRGYPIGSFLFWNVEPSQVGEFQFYKFMDYYHERDHAHNRPISLVGDSGITAVLDGQQRLTALNIGLKGWYANKRPYYHWSSDHAFPERHLHLNLGARPTDMEMAYEFKLLREDEEKQSGDDYWFPVSEIYNFDDLKDTLTFCISEGLTEAADDYSFSALADLWRVIFEKPVINYFQEEEQDLDKVLNIFIRVNSGGTLLSYSDMLLSIATAQWEEKDARQEVHGLVDELNGIGEGFAFSKDFVLKASLLLTDASSIAFKVNSFKRENTLAIEDQWNEIERALQVTARLLASWGYSRKTLVSSNAVIPLAYYIYQKGSSKQFVSSKHYADDRESMRRWLATALLKRTFSGSPDTVLRPVREVIQENNAYFPEKEIYRALAETNRSMAFDEAEIEGLLGYQYNQKYTFTVLALLYPWLRFDQRFDKDHIFPRSLLSERNLSKRDIPEHRWGEWLEHKDDLANLQLMQGVPNMEKSDLPPQEWMNRIHNDSDKRESYRDRHFIPDTELTVENFPEFRERREKLIREQLSELLMEGSGVRETATY